MPLQNELCSKCGKNGLECDCELFHPNVTDVLFSIEEIRTLYKLLEHQYIHYENTDAHAVLNKISRILA